MPTPPLNGAASISQRTGGLRNPWSSDDLEDAPHLLRHGRPLSGSEADVAHRDERDQEGQASMTARRTYGTPRFVTWAMTPPARVPVSIAIPPAI